MPRTTVIISASIPAGLLAASKEFAIKNGISLSMLLSHALSAEIGYKAEPFAKRGGNLAHTKTKETHERVCARMRAAKAEKHKEDMRRIVDALEKKSARKSEASSGAA